MSEPKKPQKKEKRYTPQQIDFAMRYYLPDSPTFGNALQSALAAKYTLKYASNITCKDVEWVDNIVGEIVGNTPTKESLVELSKKVLKKSLKGDDTKLAQDTAKFVAKSTEEFSEKQDFTTAGQALTGVTLKLVDGAISGKRD